MKPQSTLAADGGVQPLQTLKGVVEEFGSEQHLPALVAARLLLAALVQRKDVALYLPGSPGEYARRVTDADLFGPDPSGQPRYEVRGYPESPTRFDRETGRLVGVIDIDLLREHGQTLKSKQQLEEWPQHRGRAGALAMMQRVGIRRDILIEARHVKNLCALNASQEGPALQPRVKGAPWSEVHLLSLLEQSESLQTTHGDRVIGILAKKYEISYERVRQLLLKAMKLRPAAASALLDASRTWPRIGNGVGKVGKSKGRADR